MRDNITGLHHITVIAGNPQETLDFYVGVTVNHGVPGTYHLFYADGARAGRS
jgi:glyoxalase family protein